MDNFSALNDLGAEYSKKLSAQLPQLIERWQDYKVCPSADDDAVTDLIFDMHKLAGTSGVYGYQDISNTARAIELQLEAFQKEKVELNEVDRFFCKLKNISENFEAHEFTEDELEELILEKTEVIVIEDEQSMSDMFKERFTMPEFHFNYYRNFDEFYEKHQDNLEVIFAVVVHIDLVNVVDKKVIHDMVKEHEIELVLYESAGDFYTRLDAVRLGATAFFNLPLNTGMLVDYLQTSVWSLSNFSSKIMIIDDSQIFANFYKELLKKYNIEVHIVTAPSRVIEEMMSFKPELVLLDLYMPYCNGLELAKIIRQYQGFTRIPLIFFSSEDDPEVHVEAKALGADDFIEKNVVPRTLVKTIKSRLKRSRATNHLMDNDGLTGVFLRRKLDHSIANLISSYHKKKNPFCYAILDIDFFKNINDTYGHGIGDGVLKHLASMLRANLRENDLIFRYGGEEFVVLMPNTRCKDALDVIEEIRKKFSHRDYQYHNKMLKVSFSGGIVEFDGEHTVEELMLLADQALYDAKSSGKNCIEVNGLN